ncbi:putative cysteine-rich transmembrane CYSTM domain-containing protein [Rosa chinensis]|uniref:Putative cysteine-rich transmembrane CYSTM domain-containing protein n=1 Tax=Rosa chinensis TaxID=74649 RepID=A0A2P6S0R7_ROSCH|nr:putative cysteine-rich transmembrane CYSTM domain-containing protein [Rosa chinensis]
MSSSANSAAAYPAPASQQGRYIQAPPPAGYPTMTDDQLARSHGPVETKSKGDDFWKGCCAALCCCCMLDACF